MTTLETRVPTGSGASSVSMTTLCKSVAKFCPYATEMILMSDAS
jgi:hypothetical protein